MTGATLAGGGSSEVAAEEDDEATDAARRAWKSLYFALSVSWPWTLRAIASRYTPSAFLKLNYHRVKRTN